MVRFDLIVNPLWVDRVLFKSEPGCSTGEDEYIFTLQPLEVDVPFWPPVKLRLLLSLLHKPDEGIPRQDCNLPLSTWSIIYLQRMGLSSVHLSMPFSEALTNMKPFLKQH
ncbi:hypothetical protein ACRALDRAFT_206633 [Sodiomyces alcalophilus JCM 7366]|uniref:uncharacterized protein n=1 Tax=Sodiomyces alcalophilus JCM 7366 TaxID=591952 RepID=UPI0039B53A67